ncbi:helix-turn-helix transcriptional regulator [Streptomyces sp. NPDC056683]|uniref:helix-turn-helix transcriptional regulator n=1 Tax=Streptomyces sp. NPDC056683 TaxID=3345910 RepID=UPI0036C5E936
MYIADLRAPLEISQEQLADKTRISRRTIQRIETGEADPRYGALLRTMTALNHTITVVITPTDVGLAHPTR